MSLQKVQTLKYQTNRQSHTKNKLINSLINQKLSQQKQQVKNRFVKLGKKSSEQKQSEHSSSLFQIRKRSNSLKNINVSIEKIKQSVLFNSTNPKQYSQQAQFIISRQYKSPLIGQSEIVQIATMRQKGNLFEVKLNQQDKKGFQYLTLQTPKKNEKAQDMMQEIQKKLDNQLWLPSLPHTKILLQNIQDNGTKFQINQPDFNNLPLVKSSVFSNYGNDFKPIRTSSQIQGETKNSLKTSGSTKLLSISQTQRHQISYDFKKYHKDDYLSLQKWFQKNIIFAHKKNMNRQKSVNQIGKDKNLLNTLYTIHIGGFQQLIRLTYVQAWRKALIFQKMFWSLIRLFGALMQEQHKINYAEFKLFNSEIKQQRIMYEQRCQKLQIMMIRAQKQASQTQTLRKRLSIAYVTYSRVNSHLSQELQFMNTKYTQLSNSFNFVNMKFMKLIDYLKQDDKVKIIANECQTTYYLITGQNQKLQELIKIKTSLQQRKRLLKKKAQKQIQQKFIKEGKYNINKSTKAQKQQLQNAILAQRMLIEYKVSEQAQNTVFQTRLGQRILNVQNQLNKYWLHKQQSLKIRQITNQQLLNYNTADIGTSTYEKFESNQFGCQFPQKQEKSFAQFLKQEIQKQRNEHKKQIHKQNDLYVSLKQLYEESYQKIKMLQTKKNELSFEVDSKNKSLMKRQAKIKQLQSQIGLRISDSMNKNQTIQSLIRQKRQLQNIKQTLITNLQQIQKKYNQQLQNSQSLVRSNLKMKQKNQKMTIKMKQIQEKLQQIINKKNQIQIQLQKNKQQLNNYQNKYYQLHNNLQKISPSVDSFLDYKRFDKQSIVIAALKTQLEILFPQYFSTNSDLFLTK